MQKIFLYTKYFILYTIIFLFPLFFLPITQEFFITNKLYLLAFGALLLLLISTLQLLVSKKLVWVQLPFDMPIFLFVITIALSIIISSPNKIQAILNPNFGLLSIFSLAVLYFYLSRHLLTDSVKKWPHESKITTVLPVGLFLQLSSFILSLVTIIFFFQPIKIAQLANNLPQSLQFLKNPIFTPMGIQLDLAIFLGFVLIYEVMLLLKASTVKNSNRKFLILNSTFLILTCTALSLTLYTLLKPISTDLNPSISPRVNQLQTDLKLPPFRLSWYAAVETLKNPLIALLGIGIDNFSSIFTQVKDLSYNQSNLWQTYSFNVSRSTLLHIFTETGLFGLIAFSLLLFSMIKKSLTAPNTKYLILNTLYLSIVMFFFPPSLPIFFLFFIMLASIESEVWEENHRLAHRSFSEGGSEKRGIGLSYLDNKTSEVNSRFDLSSLFTIYLGIVIISFAFITITGYLLTRSYASEYYFKKALDGYNKNDAKLVYDNMRQAIILNPFIERFRINFSQTNLFIANNIASKASPSEALAKGGEGGRQASPSAQLTEQDRQNISQAIQAAIAEAKASVALNPQKAANWENLANIYRNILNVAQGADNWSISSYQRAFMADPQNPFYRLGLGGLYYSLNNFDEAIRLFEQTVILKPDWANAYYNLAWANYQKKEYLKAAQSMENVIKLLDRQKDSADYKKAQSDLEEFMKKIPTGETEATKEGEIKPQQLNLPPTASEIEPKIQLPKEASPEAR